MVGVDLRSHSGCLALIQLLILPSFLFLVFFAWLFFQSLDKSLLLLPCSSYCLLEKSGDERAYPQPAFGRVDR